MKKSHSLFYAFLILMIGCLPWLTGCADDSDEDDQDSRNISCDSGYGWKSCGQAPWSPRAQSASVVFKDKIWMMGGEYFDTGVRETYNDVWTFDGSRWSRVTAAADWSARDGHAAVVYKNKIWVLGGSEKEYDKRSDVWSSADGVNWTRVTAAAPWGPRERHTALVFQNRIWVLAGRDYPTDTRNDVWSSYDGANWTRVTAAATWPKGANHNFLVFQNQFWMLESQDPYSSSSTRNVWTSVNGANWEKTIIQGSKQISSRAVVFQDKIWLTGGTIGYDSSSEVWFSGDGLTWFRDYPGPWQGRYGHNSVAFQDRLWAFGGNPSHPDQELNDVWSYYPGN